MRYQASLRRLAAFVGVERNMSSACSDALSADGLIVIGLCISEQVFARPAMDIQFCIIATEYSHSQVELPSAQQRNPSIKIPNLAAFSCIVYRSRMYGSFICTSDH